MSAVFSRQGFRELRGSWALLVVAIAAAAGLAVGGKLFLEHDKRQRMSSSQKLQEAQNRLDVARRERDNLNESADIFRTLVSRGLLQSERRLEMVELLNGLRARHNLFGLDYEISPQRQLQFPGGRVFPAVEVLSSRVRLRIRALHEGDVLGVIEGLGQSRQGFYPFDRCVMRRVEVPAPDAVQPRVEAECAFEWITLREKNAGRPG